MVSSDITRVPVRLAQEDGGTIELDVTAMDIVVERSSSQIAVPFRDGQRFGIDLNMPQISVALTGVLVDEEGTNVPSEGAKTEFDFGSTQFNSTATNAGTAHLGGIPGMGSGRPQMPSGGGGQCTVGAWLPTTQFGVSDPFAAVQNINELDKLYFEMPVDYLTSGTGGLGVPSSPVTGMALHLDAGQGVTKAIVSGYGDQLISQWADQSGNSRHATQSTDTNKPWVVESIFNGHPALRFTSDASLSISGAGAALNPEEYTIFVVFSGARTADSPGPILGNKESGSDKGYNLFYTTDDTCLQTDTVRFRTFDSGGAEDVALPDFTCRGFLDEPHIITAQASGSSGSQVMTIRNNGLSGTTTSSLTLIERTSGDFQIALDAGTSASDNFDGCIAEILIYTSALSTLDVLKNESYLAKKYNIALDPEHTYYGATAALQTSHIRFTLDALSNGTVKEPHYYLNHQRVTNLIVSGYDPSTKIVSFSSGDAREWFELTGQPVRVAKDATSAYFGTVTAIAANGSTITVNEVNSGTRPSSGALYIAPWRTADMQHTPDVQPVISIPVRDLLSHSGTYQNGAQRDTMEAHNATELFTYRVREALQSSDSLGSNALIEAGGTSAGSVFSVKALSSTSPGWNSRLEIEQRRKIDLTNTALHILPSRPLEVSGSRPIMNNFTGGRAGNFIKSAGDKTQDLIGVLNNSQNFFKGNKTNAPSWLTSLENIYSNHIYNVGAARDYIYGIQIPYMSTVNREYTTSVNNPPVSATARGGSDTTITLSISHGLAVGDTIEILTQNSNLTSPTTSLLGTHVVKSVTASNQFTIELDSSANTFSLFGYSAAIMNIAITYQTQATQPFNVPYVQRNFFLTTGNAIDTLDKTSVRNTTPAKTTFDINQDGHRKSGIQIAVDEFNVKFNAEDRLYEFDLTMLAVDYLL